MHIRAVTYIYVSEQAKCQAAARKVSQGTRWRTAHSLECLCRLHYSARERIPACIVKLKKQVIQFVSSYLTVSDEACIV